MLPGIAVNLDATISFPWSLSVVSQIWHCFLCEVGLLFGILLLMFILVVFCDLLYQGVI